MGILAWIVFGLAAGFIAKFIMPGRDGGGLILTMVLGIVGAVVGGFIANALNFGAGPAEFDLRSLVVAVIGALVVLFVFRLIRSRAG
ncbi:GlsB/YeaQ/YmgE family stress response membrane protein [Dongia sp.]|uniref:GlsB/YeaQ/YmgE family stress response membrane protein n=1 Tax=Dongia sp. TaxID=1977262 RepID=UPI0037524904